MTRPAILIIDNYDSFTWNLVHYLEELGAKTRVIRNDELSVTEALAIGADGIVLSPGPCTPNEAGICVALVKSAPPQLPILGVCLGHQSIAAAEGAIIDTALAIRHGKISEIRNNSKGLFKGLPERFNVVRYHSLSIKPTSLPDSLRVDARTDDQEIMAVTHTTRPVFGVQFHPESISTENGHAMLKNWLAII
ncbi:MAG: Anthranilate synthase component 2 [Hyphomonas sp. TMED17]|nr:MAG: aminodeoxychorismate/anthranilate synthase component II [Hyphomonas sp. TMED17]CAI8381658.1 MAG: Anthranilate synthase component 2 [Hyphomonas sp. TMED17]